MNLQDRAYAAGIFIVIGICCIGAYVAVSGFMNATPGGLHLGLGSGTESPTSELQPALPTQTEATVTLTSVSADTPAIPTITPKGFKPSPTPRSRGTPSPDFLSQLPTEAPTTSVESPTPIPTRIAGCGLPFCPRGGPPSSNAPTGQPCPQNYLWGFVLDQNGHGIAGVKVQYSNVDIGTHSVVTKGPPDPAGRYDIPTGSGVWTLQLIDLGGSPAYRIQAHQSYSGSGNCPTRVDFVQQ